MCLALPKNIQPSKSTQTREEKIKGQKSLESKKIFLTQILHQFGSFKHVALVLKRIPSIKAGFLR